MIDDVRVEVLPHHLQRVLELDEAAQRQVLGLHRHDHAGRGRERVDRQQAERRRRVDEDVVVAILDRRQRLLERALAADLARQRQLGAGEVDRRDGDVDLARLDHLVDRHAGARARRTSSARSCPGSGPGTSSGCPADRGRCRARAAPARASATPRLSVVVVFATPPFWFASAITRASAGPFSAAGAPQEARAREKTCDGHVRGLFCSGQRIPSASSRSFPTASREPPPLSIRAHASASWTSSRSSPSSCPAGARSRSSASIRSSRRSTRAASSVPSPGAVAAASPVVSRFLVHVPTVAAEGVTCLSQLCANFATLHASAATAVERARYAASTVAGRGRSPSSVSSSVAHELGAVAVQRAPRRARGGSRPARRARRARRAAPRAARRAPPSSRRAAPPRAAPPPTRRRRRRAAR